MKSISSTTKKVSNRDPQRASGKDSEKSMHSKQHQDTNDTISFPIVDTHEQSDEEENQPMTNLEGEDISSTEEDEETIEQTMRLEKLKKLVIDAHIEF